jgi:hypothetical protein
MSTSFTVGRHECWQEEDLFGVRFHGPILGDDARGLLALLGKLLEERGRCLLLGDMRDMTGFDSSARREVAHWNRDHKLTGVAVYGGSFAIRAVSMLALKAIKLLGRDPDEVVFVADEAEARRWLAARPAQATMK